MVQLAWTSGFDPENVGSNPAAPIYNKGTNMNKTRKTLSDLTMLNYSPLTGKLKFPKQKQSTAPKIRNGRVIPAAVD